MSKSGRRYTRTTTLGIVAMAALIWGAMDQFGIAPQEMAGLFLSILLAAALVIAAAATAVLLWMGLRKLLGRKPD